MGLPEAVGAQQQRRARLQLQRDRQRLELARAHPDHLIEGAARHLVPGQQQRLAGAELPGASVAHVHEVSVQAAVVSRLLPEPGHRACRRHVLDPPVGLLLVPDPLVHLVHPGQQRVPPPGRVGVPPGGLAQQGAEAVGSHLRRLRRPRVAPDPVEHPHEHALSPALHRRPPGHLKDEAVLVPAALGRVARGQRHLGLEPLEERAAAALLRLHAAPCVRHPGCGRFGMDNASPGRFGQTSFRDKRQGVGRSSPRSCKSRDPSADFAQSDRTASTRSARAAHGPPSAGRADGGPPERDLCPWRPVALPTPDGCTDSLIAEPQDRLPGLPERRLASKPGETGTRGAGS